MKPIIVSSTGTLLFKGDQNYKDHFGKIKAKDTFAKLRKKRKKKS